MAKVNFVQKAAKAYPNAGIAKGDSYYWWQHFRQPRQMSKTRPNPSQVASSEYERTLLALVEDLNTADETEWGEAERDSLVSELEQLRDAEQEKFDNMPEGFQQGDTGQQIEEHVSTLDEWITELESIDFEDESPADTPLAQALSSAP
jgi:hypothetical protein